MEILNGKPEGNELAEAAAVDHIKYSIKMLDDIDDWMQTAKSPAQPMLAVIDILLYVGEKYPYDFNLLLRKNKIEQWKTTFNQWFNKNKKIPDDIKNDIKISADVLFEKLEKYGH